MNLTLLFDSVVSCMGAMWCFSDGIWQECAYDGYVWKFLANDFIEYLQSKNAEKNRDTSCIGGKGAAKDNSRFIASRQRLGEEHQVALGEDGPRPLTWAAGMASFSK